MIQNRGQYLDCNPINQPPGTWRNAKNIIVNKVKKAIITEPGTDLTATGYPSDIAIPIGVTAFPDGSYVIYSESTEGNLDRLGLVTNGVYTDIIVDDILGFSAEYPIRASEFEFNVLGQRIIAWTDRNQTAKILNIDQLPFALNPDKSLVNSNDINDLEIFPKMTIPQSTFTIGSNGTLRSGNYSYSFAYENSDGTRTPNVPFFHNINITEDNVSVGFDKFDGVAPNTITNKSITLALTNVDTRYDKLVLLVAYRSGGQISFYEIKKIDISNSSMSVTHIGTELTTQLTSEEVLTPRPLYNKVGCMTQLEGNLYLGDLESDDAIDYQAIANNIRLFYNTKLTTITDLNTSQKFATPAGFTHGGVYAIYIAFLLKNGSWSKAFHIPGAPSNQFNAPTGGTGYNNVTGKVYQITDTTNQGGHSYSVDGDTLRVTSMATGTNMGYWENENEVYPAEFPGLAGQKVRHHVFPTFRKCKTLHYSGEPGYGREKLDILGLDVTNVTIPIELQGKIEGWTILYAKRDYINSNILGTDIFLASANPDNDINTFWSSGGNWKTRSFSGSGGWEVDFTPNNTFMRGHNLDLLKDKPSLGSNNLYIDYELKIVKNNLAADFLNQGKAGGNIAKSGEGEGQNAGVVVDMTDNINTVVTATSVGQVKRILEFKYLPANITDLPVRTIKTEEIVSMRLDPVGDLPLNYGEAHVNSSGRTPGPFIQGNNTPPFVNGGEETYFSVYKQVRNNLFTNYDNQLLVVTDKIALKNESFLIKIYGGDTFIGVRSFITSAPRHANDFEAINGVAAIRAHAYEGRYNVGLRYEVIGNNTSKYYPKTPAQNFWNNPSDPDEDGVQMIFDRSSNPNVFIYNDESNSVNDLSQLVIYNPSQTDTSKFPYRVIRSGKANATTNSINSWKTYLATDYYESNRNRGKVNNLFVLDDNLFIHHYYGLFRTLGTEKLQLETTEVFLGSGDIFSRRPKELVNAKLGYLGNQNIFASVLFKDYYFWCDQSQGRVFLLNTNNGAVELSGEGMFNYFRDNLKINNSYPDSPIIGESLLACYDPKYDRIILTKKSNSNAWTRSFSLEKGQNFWVTEHDYIPDYLFNTNEDYFGFKNNQIHKFNSTIRVARYFEGNPMPSYIEVVFNQETQLNKEFFSLNWISECFNNGVLVPNKTISHIQTTTSYQDSGEVILIPHTSFINKGNIRRMKNSWYFNNFKHPNSDSYKRKNMVDNYCVVKFKYDNALNLDNSQNTIYLYLLSANAKLVEL